MSEHPKEQLHEPEVGVGILIVREHEILLGNRRGSHGSGEYAVPGGCVDYQETLEQCVRRELKEELGPNFIVTNLARLCLTDMPKKYGPRHFIDIGFSADWVTGEPLVMEKDKVEKWEWFDKNYLPEPLFGCLSNYVEAHKTGRWDFGTLL